MIHQILEDLASASNHAFIEDIVNVFLPAPGELPEEEEARNDALIELITDIIEAVKGQVRVKHWRAELP